MKHKMGSLYSLMLVMVCLVSVLSRSSSKAGPVGSRCWFEYAKAGLEISQKLLIEQEDAIAAYNKYERTIQDFRQCPPPTSEEVLAIFRSGDHVPVKTALFAMSIRPIQEDGIIKYLITFLGDRDPEIRFLAARGLRLSEASKIKPFRQMIYGFIEKETGEVILTEEIPVIAKLNGDRSIDLLIQFLRSDSRVIKTVAYMALKTMNEKCFQEVIRKLKEVGDYRTIEFMNLQREKEKAPGGRIGVSP